MTHRFTDRSNRSHLSLLSTLTLWCESKMTWQHITGDKNDECLNTLTMLTVLPAGPIVPGMPGWPASPYAETSKILPCESNSLGKKKK